GYWILSNELNTPGVDITFSFGAANLTPLIWTEAGEGLPGGPGAIRNGLSSADTSAVLGVNSTAPAGFDLSQFSNVYVAPGAAPAKGHRGDSIDRRPVLPLAVDDSPAKGPQTAMNIQSARANVIDGAKDTFDHALALDAFFQDSAALRD